MESINLINNNPLKNIERRKFFRILSLTSIGTLIYSEKLISKELHPDAKSDIIVISNPNATNPGVQTVNQNVVKSMVDEGITTYTGISDVGNAWKSIFPGITSGNVIGIKVNTLFSTRNNGTHPQIVKAITDGLIQMNFYGTTFPANNIIIFDFPSNYLTTQGFTLNSSGTGIRCFPTSTYSSQNYSAAGISLKISTIITQQINFLINIGCLKHHSITGVTHCLKSHFGSVNNPGNCHGNYGNPYIPAINAFEPIRSKQKLCMVDALYGVTSNGPGGNVNCNPNKIIMGQDIVAVDFTARELLLTYGLAMSEYNKATHIDAAATTYSLGTNSPSQINTINILNTGTGIENIPQNNKFTELFQNFPNPFSDKTNIQFYLQSAGDVRIRIYDYKGRIITQLLNNKLNQGMYNVVWESHNSQGRTLSPGVYLCELITESYNRSIIMHKI